MDAGREPPRSAGLAFVNIFSLPEAAICKGASACCADWLFVVFVKRSIPGKFFGKALFKIKHRRNKEQNKEDSDSNTEKIVVECLFCLTKSV